MATDTHPTREEWAARQAGGPPGMAGVLAAVAARKALRDAAAEVDRQMRQAEADAARAEFTAAIRGILAAIGCEWLMDYQSMPAASLDNAGRAQEWTSCPKCARVEFDPAPVGMWPITITLYRTRQIGDSPDYVWYIPDCGWQVHTPTQTRPKSNALDAIEAAAEYVATPF